MSKIHPFIKQFSLLYAYKEKDQTEETQNSDVNSVCQVATSLKYKATYSE